MPDKTSFVSAKELLIVIPPPDQGLRKSPLTNHDKNERLEGLHCKRSVLSAEEVSVDTAKMIAFFQSPSNRYDKNGPIVSPLLSIS